MAGQKSATHHPVRKKGGKKGKASATHYINIIDTNDGLKAVPAHCHVDPGDTVIWHVPADFESANMYFEHAKDVFDGDPPDFAVFPTAGKNRGTIERTVKVKAPKGTYPYDVCVERK